MRYLPRALMLASALTLAGLTGGCFYSHTVDKTPPTVVTTTPDSTSTTTTTTTANGQVERQTNTTYPNP